jgi:hypothetical protein
MPIAAHAQADTLQSPQAFLGYAPGKRFTPHSRILDYYQHVAAHSKNVKLMPYGSTYEGRKLLVAVIGTEDHLNRLDEIRLDNQMRAGIVSGKPKNNGPAIAWLSYNIHGNEPVSSEASLVTLYNLARPGNAKAAEWLKKVLVVIDPCMNPDGRERYVQWYNRTHAALNVSGPDAHPASWEHSEPWPYGRSNHYFFDMNRDWAWQTQQESKQRTALLQQWLPHVHADLHEMGAQRSYYFLPAAEPYHEQVTPWQREFQEYLGKVNARYFEEQSWRFFSREDFDLLYPSYGDTWPTFMGAIGMTYEQAGGNAGLALKLNNGDTLTLVSRVAHHAAASLATVEATYDKADKLISEFAKFYADNAASPPGQYKTYVVKGNNAADNLAAFCKLLAQNGIQYGYASSADKRLFSGYNYFTGKNENMSLEPGDVVVSAHQPRAAFVRVLMEPKSKLADSLTYDITAWSLPFVYGLKTYGLAERMTPQTNSGVQPKTVLAMEKPYAYLAEWKSTTDAQLLAKLLRAKINVRYAEKPFTIGGVEYPSGTMVVLRADNLKAATLDETLRREAAALGQTLTPVATGRVEKGPDLGSDYFHFIKAPRVAVLLHNEIETGSIGELWYHFEQELQYPVTLIDVKNTRRFEMKDFDVIILPDGDFGDQFEGRRFGALREWMQAGGKIIALESAVGLFAGRDKDGFTLKEKSDSAAVKKLQAANALRPYADRERAAISDFVPGSIFRLRMDNTHPLGFGYGEEYHTLKLGSKVYEYLTTGINVGTLKKDGHVAGFVGANVKNKLQEGLVFGVERQGRGSIVYLIDNPLFRAFWHNGKLLFDNAVFLVGQ